MHFVARSRIKTNRGDFIRFPTINYAARSDVGRVRRNNEDNIFCCEEFLTEETRELPFKTSGHISAPSIFAICDGVGGYQMGEQASLIAVQILSEFAGSIHDSPVQQLDEVIHDYANTVNQRIQQTAANYSTHMGTTPALAVALPDEVRAYNIGDSRIYALDKSGFRQVSVDHTLAMNKVNSGAYTEVQARQSDDWNKLTACLGFFDDNGNDYRCEVSAPIKLINNIRLQLCSDGVTDVLSDYFIEQTLRTNKKAEKAVRTLVSEALNNGGTDNTTAIVADIAPDRLSRVLRIPKKLVTRIGRINSFVIKAMAV